MVYRPLRYEQMMKAAEGLDVRARRMFGGMGVYTGEKMFAFLVNAEIGLKLSPEDAAEAMQLKGSDVMRPDAQSEPLRGYVKMPKSVLDNFDCFCRWVDRSATFVQEKASTSSSTSSQ